MYDGIAGSEEKKADTLEKIQGGTDSLNTTAQKRYHESKADDSDGPGNPREERLHVLLRAVE